MVSYYSFRLRLIFCVSCVSYLFFPVKVTFFFIMCALSGKAIPEMTYTVLGGTLNLTQSFAEQFLNTLEGIYF